MYKQKQVTGFLLCFLFCFVLFLLNATQAPDIPYISLYANLILNFFLAPHIYFLQSDNKAGNDVYPFVTFCERAPVEGPEGRLPVIHACD